MVQKVFGFVTGMNICLDLELKLLYNIVFNKLVNGMNSV